MMQQTFQLDPEEKERIKSSIIDIIKTIKDVKFAYIHGSFLEDRDFHDIDIAIFINANLMLKDPLEYEISLSSILERKVRLPVDVKVLNYAHVAFRYEVTRGKVIFSRDEETRLIFVERTWTEYLDYKPVAESILRDLVA